MVETALARTHNNAILQHILVAAARCIQHIRGRFILRGRKWVLLLTDGLIHGRFIWVDVGFIEHAELFGQIQLASMDSILSRVKLPYG